MQLLYKFPFPELFVLCVPIKLSRTPAVIDRAPPALGQHTEEILAELPALETAAAAADAGE